MEKDGEWFNEIQKQHSSLENYLVGVITSGAEPLLFGYAPFSYLINKELLKLGDILRTNLEGGLLDGHYQITFNGKLKGIEAAGGLYSGEKGIHDPRRILSLKKADNGWTLDSYAQHRIKMKVKKV